MKKRLLLLGFLCCAVTSYGAESRLAKLAGDNRVQMVSLAALGELLTAPPPAPAPAARPHLPSRYVTAHTDGVVVRVPNKKEFFSRLVALLAPLASEGLSDGARVIDYRFDEGASQQGSLVFESTVRRADGERINGGCIEINMAAKRVKDAE